MGGIRAYIGGVLGVCLGVQKGSIGKGFGSPFWPVLEGPNRGQNGSNLEASKEPLSDPIRPPWEGLEGPL